MDERINWPSCISFFALVILVWKKYGSWWLCIDYRELNKIVVKENFPIPIINVILGELHGVSYFSKLDLHSSYHQIWIQEENFVKYLNRSEDKNQNKPTMSTIMNQTICYHLYTFEIFSLIPTLFIRNFCMSFKPSL